MSRNLNPRQFDARAYPEGDSWNFDVSYSSHDELKRGLTEPRRSHIVLSREEFPEMTDAHLVASQWPMARSTSRHGKKNPWQSGERDNMTTRTEYVE